MVLIIGVGKVRRRRTNCDRKPMRTRTPTPKLEAANLSEAETLLEDWVVWA